MSTGTYPSTGTYSSRGSMGWFRLYVTATNKTNGTTDIKCELQHRRGSKLTFSNNPSGSITVTVAGVSKSLSLPKDLALNTATGTWATVYTQTLNFTRTQANQSASIVVNNLAYYSYNTSTTWSAVWDTLNAGSYTYTLTLDTIQLNSTFAAYPASAYTGQNFAISVNRNSTSFYHKVRFKYGGTTLATTSAFADSVTYEVPRSWMENDTSATSIQVTVELTTYSSSDCTSQVGSTVSVTSTINADDEMVPVLNTGAVTVSPENTGAIAGLTGYIKGYSKVKAVYDTSKVSLSNCAGATISSYKFEVEGVAYTGSPATSNAVKTAGTLSVKATITDTRGRSATYTEDITVIDYWTPKMSVTETYRSDAEGNKNDSGKYMSCKATFSVAPLNGQNTVVCKASIEGTDYVLQTGVRSVCGDNALNPDAACLVTFTCTDRLGNVNTYTVKIPTRVWAMQFKGNGSGVAFGKAAEREHSLEIPDGWNFAVGGKTIFDLIYPVGSYYWTSETTDPNTVFGGTWERVKDRFVYAVGDGDDVGATGGSDSVTLTKENIPNYELGKIATVVPPEHGKWSNGGISDSNLGAISSTKKGVYCPASNSITVTSGTQWSWTIGSNGGDEAHDNMPPYVTAYCWHRTA